jgi:hypothetical protein
VPQRRSAAAPQRQRGTNRPFGSLEHDLKQVLGHDHAFVLEADNRFTTLDGRAVTVRAVAFTDRGEDGRVTSVRLHGDTSALYAPPEAAAEPPGAVPG